MSREEKEGQTRQKRKKRERKRHDRKNLLSSSDVAGDAVVRVAAVVGAAIVLALPPVVGANTVRARVDARRPIVVGCPT